MPDKEISGDIKFTPKQPVEPEPREGELAGTITVTGEVAGILNRVAETNRTVTLERSEKISTKDQPLWVAIRNRTGAIGFKRYFELINRVICQQSDKPNCHMWWAFRRPCKRHGPPKIKRASNIVSIA